MLGIFAIPANATAGINQELSFEGKIVNASGINIADGHYNIEFTIYTGCTDNMGTGCTTVWTEDWLDPTANTGGVTFTSGTFQVNLGTNTAFGSSVPWNTYPLYLSLNVGTTAQCTSNFATCGGGDGVMNPRILLTATPYAMNSNQLGGLTSSQYVQLGQNANGSPQGDASTNNSIYINKTAAGNIIDLQSSGNEAFLISNSGDATFGNSANHVISVTTAGSGVAGKQLSVAAGAAGTGGSALAGGNLVLQGGAGGGTNGAGGNITIDGGVHNGSGADGSITIGTNNASAITIGNTNASVSIEGSNAGAIAIGNGATAHTINIGNGSGSNNATVNIASGTTTTGIAAITIGSANAAASAVLIQGGNAGTAIQLQTAASGTISIGNNAVANVVQIGQNGNNAVTQSINIGNGGATSTTNVLMGNSVAGTTTINGAGGVSINTNLASAGTTVKSTTNSTTAFQVQNSGTAQLLNIDTTNPITDITNNANNNLVTNGSMEANATGWAKMGVSQVAPTQDNTQQYIGNYSLKVLTTATNTDGAEYALTTSTLVSNTQYVMTLYARLANNGVSMTTFEIGHADNGSTNTSCLTAQTVTSNGWTKFTCTFTTGTTSGTPYIYAKQTDAAIHTFYIDGVSLTRWSLLANAQAEQAAGAGNWQVKGGSTTVAQDATQFYDGTHSIKIVTSSTASNNDGAKNNITLNDSTLYSLTFQAKLDSGSTAFTTMEAGYSSDGSNDNTVCITGQTVVTTGWTQYSCNFVTPASHSGTPWFYIKELNTTGPKTFYIDAVQLAISNPLGGYQEGKIALNGVVNSPLTLQSQTNSTTALQIQNATGANMFQVDTTNGNIYLNTTSNSSGGLPGKVFVQNTSANGQTGLFDIEDGNNSTGGANQALLINDYYAQQSTGGNFPISAVLDPIIRGTAGIGGTCQPSCALGANFFVGQSLSTGNAAYMGYYDAGATNSADSALSLGLYGYDHIVNIYNNAAVEIGATSTNPGTHPTTAGLIVQNGTPVPILTADTTNMKVVIGKGGATGDTTGYLLVLDNKTNTADPTGTIGAMYYSSASSAFRCYQGVIGWTDCAGVPTPNNQRWTYITYKGTGTAFDTIGDIVTSIGGVTPSASVATTTEAPRLTYTTTATIGNAVGITGNPNYAALTSPDLQTHISGAISGVRWWVALTNQTAATMDGSATPAGNYAGFRFDTGAGDTNYMCVTNNNTTPTVVSSGIAATSTGAHFEVILNETVGTSATFKINGQSVCNSPITTTIPTSSTLLNYQISDTTLGAATKALNIQYVYVSDYYAQ